MAEILGASERLVDDHDLAMLDLDGVVYVSGDVVEHAAESIAEWRSAERGLAFITNNASRPPQTVVDHLRSIGVPAELDDVVTSAQAVAAVLRDAFGSGARVAVLGGQGLLEAVGEAGLQAVGVEEDAVAGVTGYGPDVVWSDLMRFAVRVRDGLPWYASNTDLSIPTAYGTAPGHGVLVRMLQDFTGVDPTVAGKPEPPLLRETMARVGGSRPLMVGDRLDTDIAGGSRADVASLLVLTGVTDLAVLVAASEEERPTYIAPDLRGLFEPQEAIEHDGATTSCGGWSATIDDGRLRVDGSGAASSWWRAAAAASWRWADEHGTPPSVEGVDAPDASRDSLGA